jgi:dTDP-4-amino-4,6-dideoxygalactose transaminase
MIHSNTIPFVDLVGQSNELCDEIIPAIEQVIRSASFILGDEVQRFEQQFAEYCDAAHCISVASGTDALHLALLALDIGKGDEVITVANTFAATALAIAYTGATPVFVDIATEDYNMDPQVLEDAVTAKTKAIVPVHLYGQPAEMDEIRQIADRHGLAIVEDACQAHGAYYRQSAAGTMGSVGCFSFYPGKNLGAFGDGGAIVCNDGKLAERLRLLRNYGQRVKNEHSMIGYNSRLDTVQAAVLRVKLAYLDRWNEQRREAAAWYGELLTAVGAPVELPIEKSHVRHVYHLYVVQHDDRDGLIDRLRELRIQCGVHYPNPVCHAKPFRDARTVPDGAPLSTRVAKRIVSLPMYPGLTRDTIHHIANTIVGGAQVEA